MCRSDSLFYRDAYGNCAFPMTVDRPLSGEGRERVRVRGSQGGVGVRILELCSSSTSVQYNGQLITSPCSKPKKKT